MKKQFGLLFSLLLSLFISAQTKDTHEFIFNESLLEGFKKVVPTKEQSKLYDYIFVSNDNQVQVRYTFRPDMKNVKPDAVETYATALFLNNAKSKVPGSIKVLPSSKEDVQTDFGGTSAYFALFETDKTFGAEFPFCLSFLIYKESAGAFEIHLLAKTQEDFSMDSHVQAFAGKIIHFNTEININPNLQKKYLPTEIQNLYIGMNQDAIKKLRPKMQMPKDAYDNNLIENFSTGTIKQITCMMLPDKTVDEFIVEYRDEAKALEVAKQMYHTPNDVSAELPLKWEFKLSDGLILKCWVFRNKICIADSRQF
ncbi:MAG: hypothetical protein K2Q21_02030 [Chitinophagaceae bacterium]|nr:hypothetical protein [Chitinophagaceae bacterium]